MVAVDTYLSFSKQTQRSQVLGLYEMEMDDKKRKPILYLDSKDCSATEYFKSRGVPNKHLHAVNWSEDECRIIRKKNVDVTNDNIMNVLTDLPDNSFSVTWLDLTCTSKKVQWMDLQEAFRVSNAVLLVCSLRGTNGDDMEQKVWKACKATGCKVEGSPLRYAGKSGKRNMASILIDCREKKTPSKKREPEKGKESAVRDQKPKMTIVKKDSPGEKKAAFRRAQSYVGKYILIPVAQFGALEEDDFLTHKENDCLAFYIDRTHYKTRLSFRRVYKDGTKDTKLETWVYYPHELKRFSVRHELRAFKDTLFYEGQ